PTSEEEKANAAADILSTPAPFAVLTQRFDGAPLPSNEILGNILHNEAGVPVSRKNILAACFIRSAQVIGQIDPGGILRRHAPIPASATTQLDNGQPISSQTMPAEQQSAPLRSKRQTPPRISGS